MNETKTDWQRSSFCANNACVEVARVDQDEILVRDAKNPHVAPLSFSWAEWEAFRLGVRAGQFRF